ncbi:hypothetical protein [Aquimarina mytili]|uniref:Uncharacterized protein n=1 Tax=Aquimarina mytili TaxID=874423 RepID=A0A937A735_9FLAO|nr:hypothetical protein [Aquimarina mytili]MBL0686075.1 hypothetical protein [Aquimarina mytili]
MKHLIIVFISVLIISCEDNDTPVPTYQYILDDKKSELVSEYIGYDESTRTLTNRLTFNFVRNTEVYNGDLVIAIIPKNFREREEYSVQILDENNEEINTGFNVLYPINSENNYSFTYILKLNEDFNYNVTDLGYPDVSVEVSAVNSDVLWHNRRSYPTFLKLTRE